RRWPLDVLGERLRRLPRPPAWVGRAAAAVVGGLVLGTLGPSVAGLVVDRAAAFLRIPPLGALQAVNPWLGLTAAIGVLGMLQVARRRDPIRAVREAVSWHRSLVAHLPPQGRSVARWALHLLIAWAFASTLYGFLQANLAQALAAGWPGAPERFRTFAHALLYAATHLPRFDSVTTFFEVAKYVLWSATIVGCLVGYLHTIASPLWRGSKLEHVDFTIPGWVTNALCYPLLGPAIWTLLPERPGLDPLVVGGLPHALAMVTGFWLNLLYTLSIWSMGTRFGVMVDKGLVDHGFYAVVRHPSYALESVMFVVLDIAGLTTWRQWWAVSSWFLLYWMRSEREDDFMGEVNPDYAPYRQRVPYKYVPGIW
ncbi:MAG: hypothetical protein KC656_25885, partial [Myxococcales bacterium]|nr:hypothetical protein [Myxococcales bacterium]